MNDPVLREKFVEKYNGLRHNGSDQTLPQSFWSSKYGDRKTHANTYLYNTPNKSDKDGNMNVRKSPRFTQYSNTDFIGDDGQINDDAAMVRARNQSSTHIGITDTENSKIKTTPHSKPTRNERNQYYGDNFSFLEEHKLRNKIDHGYQKYDRVGRFLKSVDIDDNDNDLVNEVEINIDRKYIKNVNISDPPYERKEHGLGNRSKSHHRMHNQDMNDTEEQINALPSCSKDIFSQYDLAQKKHSSSRHLDYQDESDVGPGNDKYELSSKPLEEMKVNTTAMCNRQYDIANSEKESDKSNSLNLGTPNKKKQTQYLEKIVNEDNDHENPIKPDDSQFKFDKFDNSYHKLTNRVDKSSRNEFIKKDSKDIYSSHESSRHIRSSKLNKKRSQKYTKINMTESDKDNTTQDKGLLDNVQKRYYKSDKKPKTYNSSLKEEYKALGLNKNLDTDKDKDKKKDLDTNEGDLTKSAIQHYKNQIKTITKVKNKKSIKNSNNSSKLYLG